MTWDHEPTREEVLVLLGRTPAHGEVPAVNYVDYVVAIKESKNIGTKEKPNRVPTWHAYLSVDGRIAWAWADHQKAGKALDIITTVGTVAAETEGKAERILAMATVTSGLYGTVTAHAEGVRGGYGVGSSFPIETAETSAVGRALGLMGYGLIPGSGIPSAEEVGEARKRDGEEASPTDAKAPSKAAGAAPSKAAGAAPPGRDAGPERGTSEDSASTAQAKFIGVLAAALWPGEDNTRPSFHAWLRDTLGIASQEEITRGVASSVIQALQEEAVRIGIATMDGEGRDSRVVLDRESRAEEPAFGLVNGEPYKTEEDGREY
jgi:hypothetical protein